MEEDAGYPNYNNTIYWNPLVTVQGGEKYGFNCVLPAYKGKFRIVVEGLDSNGEEVYCTETFKVE